MFFFWNIRASTVTFSAIIDDEYQHCTSSIFFFGEAVSESWGKIHQIFQKNPDLCCDPGLYLARVPILPQASFLTIQIREAPWKIVQVFSKGIACHNLGRERQSEIPDGAKYNLLTRLKSSLPHLVLQGKDAAEIMARWDHNSNLPANIIATRFMQMMIGSNQPKCSSVSCYQCHLGLLCQFPRISSIEYCIAALK